MELDKAALEKALDALCAERKIGAFRQLWLSDQESIRGQAVAAITAYLDAMPATPTRIGSRGRTAEGVETVVVPLDPTAEMLTVGFAAGYEASGNYAGKVYRAMTSPEALEEGR
jgi:hypothetical protein